MTLSIIAAIARNFAIGKDNGLLYRMPNDMKRFKATTTGHPVVMGRRTFESFPRRPLPNRRNIVMTRTVKFPEDTQGAEWVNSLQDALDLCRAEDEVFVIGGEQVYRQALPLADRLYLTVIDDSPSGADAFFPTVDWSEWEEVSREEHEADERHAHGYVFIDLVRKR